MDTSGARNTGELGSVHKAEVIFRNVLGANLQTGAFRAILLLAGFSFVGALLAYLVI